MHRQQSPQSLRALRLGACHFLFNIILVIAAVGGVTAGLIIHDREWIWIGTALIAVWVISIFLFFLISHSSKCPLCMGRLWVKTGCRKHQKAVQTLGISYRLGIAIAAVLGRHYRCPYCGEPFSTTKTRR